MSVIADVGKSNISDINQPLAGQASENSPITPEGKETKTEDNKKKKKKKRKKKGANDDDTRNTILSQIISQGNAITQLKMIERKTNFR